MFIFCLIAKQERVSFIFIFAFLSLYNLVHTREWSWMLIIFLCALWKWKAKYFSVSFFCLFVCFCFASASGFVYSTGRMMSKKISCHLQQKYQEEMMVIFLLVLLFSPLVLLLPLMKEERKTQKGSGSVKGSSQIRKREFRKLIFRCGLIPGRLELQLSLLILWHSFPILILCLQL